MDPTQNETKSVDKTESQFEAMSALSVPRPTLSTEPDLLVEEQSGVNRSPEQLKQIRIVEDMLNSLELNPKNTISLTVPAGVTDIEAMRALNYYNHGKSKLAYGIGIPMGWKGPAPMCPAPSIDPDDHEWYRSLPEKYPAFCRERDYTDVRRINVQLRVKGTMDLDFERQAAILKLKGLSFADPRDLAIALGVCRSWSFEQSFWGGFTTLDWDAGGSEEHQGSVPGSVLQLCEKKEVFSVKSPKHVLGHRWAAGSPLHG
jgi:hypothetical protein